MWMPVISWPRLDSDDDIRLGCRNVSHHYQQQSFSGLHSPGRTDYTIRVFSGGNILLARNLSEYILTSFCIFARFDLLNNLEHLHQDMDRKDEQQERLLSQMRELLTKYEESEEQKKRYMNELEAVNKKLKEANKDVQELEGQLEDKENQLKESDKKRTELRNKALQSIKE